MTDTALHDGIILDPNGEMTLLGNTKFAWENGDYCEVSRERGNDLLHGQYYEDYVLSLLFKGKTNGTYVDVGAHDPVSFSVTKYFYDRGWNGVNIEPQELYFKKLLDQRPRDFSFNLAVGKSDEYKSFYITEDGWDALASFDHNVFNIPGLEAINKTVTKVGVKPLTWVLNSLNLNEIDFLKIDVEGFENEVLEGLDLTKFRPKVIVLEYNSPLNHKGYEQYEPYLLPYGYAMGLDDTLLNRFYVRFEGPHFTNEFKRLSSCILMQRILTQHKV